MRIQLRVLVMFTRFDEMLQDVIVDPVELAASGATARSRIRQYKHVKIV